MKKMTAMDALRTAWANGGPSAPWPDANSAPGDRRNQKVTGEGENNSSNNEKNPSSYSLPRLPPATTVAPKAFRRGLPQEDNFLDELSELGECWRARHEQHGYAGNTSSSGTSHCPSPTLTTATLR